jgi:hypothetical protein
LLWSAVVVPAFQGNVFAMRYSKAEDYYVNFAAWVVGARSTAAYNDYFDRRVNLLERLDPTLDRLGAEGQEVYIWGELPWLYPLAESQPATRYMTSFYVLLIPYLDVNLGSAMLRSDPRFIVVLNDVWPKVRDDTGILRQRYYNASRGLYSIIARRYEQVATVGRARIFERIPERPIEIPAPITDPAGEALTR